MDDIKKIEEIIVAEYKAYGFSGETDFTVSKEGNIAIYISHEIPYMGKQFFTFLRTLEEKLASEYEMVKGRFFYSYYIMEYVKKK